MIWPSPSFQVDRGLGICSVIGPVNWYGPTSNLKLMFDRLVCMNGGNPREDLIDHKDPEKAMRLEHAPEWKELSRNHLEGRTAAFFCYGDGGGDEIEATGRPKILRHPQYFDPGQEPGNDRAAYSPLVWQCRYGGIEVPDNLWKYVQFGEGKKYSDNQSGHLLESPQVFREFDAWTDAFAEIVRAKGKVVPGAFRAFGYKAPGHLRPDIKLKWREFRMQRGRAPKGSSPQLQEALGLNSDTGGKAENSEGEKLRNG